MQLGGGHASWARVPTTRGRLVRGLQGVLLQLQRGGHPFAQEGEDWIIGRIEKWVGGWGWGGFVALGFFYMRVNE